MVKNLIRGIIVIATFTLVFIMCEKVLMLKSEDGIEQMKSYYLQEKNTVDVLLVGSSHIYCNVNTGELWDTYGMSAYDLGGAEQPYWNSYYFIKEALKTQHPKAIVLSVTIPGIRFDDYQSEVWLTTNLYGMHWNRNRIENTRVSTMKDSFWRVLIPMNTIHGRYTDITKDDFVDKDYDISFKGYDLRSTVVPQNAPDISNINESTPMSEKQEKYLRKIIELTKEENIPLLLVSVPFNVPEEAQKIYNYQFNIAKEEGIDYIDFNKCYDEMGLDFTTDMAEELHLNYDGGIKFSRYLGKCLKDRYDIADHRGDRLYSSWDENALIHRQEINGIELKSVDEINQFLADIDNENYVTYINCEKITANDFNGEVTSGLQKLAVDTTKISDKYATIICNGNSLFESYGNEFLTYMQDDYMNITFERKEEGDTIETNVYADTQCCPMTVPGMTMLVYDKALNEVVSFITYNPHNNEIARYY